MKNSWAVTPEIPQKKEQLSRKVCRSPKGTEGATNSFHKEFLSCWQKK